MLDAKRVTGDFAGRYLRDAHVQFRPVRLHPELHTMVCPNGADLAPESSSERVQVPA